MYKEVERSPDDLAYRVADGGWLAMSRDPRMALTPGPGQGILRNIGSLGHLSSCLGSY